MGTYLVRRYWNVYVNSIVQLLLVEDVMLPTPRTAPVRGYQKDNTSTLRRLRKIEITASYTFLHTGLLTPMAKT